MTHSAGDEDSSAAGPADRPPEIVLCELFSLVLEVPSVRPFDSFSELGGDSVRAIALTVRARALGLPIWTEDLVAEKTPDRLAALVANRSAGPSPEPGYRSDRPGTDVDRPRTLSPLQPHMLETAGVYRAETEAVQLYVDLSGELDVPRLQTAVEELVERYPNCRSGFPLDSAGEGWFRKIAPAVRLPWRYCDIRGREHDESDLLHHELAYRFDLSRPPLFRIMLIRKGFTRYRLVVTQSSILWDGWSTGILAEELAMLYSDSARATAKVATASYDTDPYDAYLRWLARQDREAAIHAWRKVLAGIDRPTVLASTAPPDSLGVASKMKLALSNSVTTTLEIRARGAGTTLSTAVQCAWGLTIAETIGSDDIAFGYTTCGRPATVPSIDRAVGLLINDVPVRMRISDEDTPARLLAQIRAQHAEMSPYEFLDSDAIQGTGGFVPLFDTLVVFQNLLRPKVSVDRAGGLRIDSYGINESIHYALVLYAYPGDSLSFELSYHPNIFSRSFIAELCERFHYYIDSIAGDAERDIASLRSGGTRKHRSSSQ